MLTADTAVDPGDSLVPDQSLELDLNLNDALSMTRERIVADDEGKWDTLVFRSNLRMRNGLLFVPQGNDGTHRMTATPWATTQLCQKLAIPPGYFKRCPEDLQADQFNYWVRQKDREQDPEEPADNAGDSERWLLRAKGNVVRGVLSDRYSKLDNHTVLDCLAPAIGTRFEVRWMALTEQSFHLRLVDPTIGKEVAKDDRLTVGIHIANSEVGLRSLTIDALVYRLVCSNGLIRLVKDRSLLSRRHVGVTEPFFQEAVRTAIGEAVATSAAFIEQLGLSVHTPIGDVEEALMFLASDGKLTQTTLERVRQSLLAEPPANQETVYGMVNALTSAAHNLPPDDRYDLEVLAGRFVESTYTTRRVSEPAAVRLAV